MKQPMMTTDEACVGRVADYLIYYRTKRGKLYYQAVYAKNLPAAEAWLKAFVKGAKIERTLVRNLGAEI